MTLPIKDHLAHLKTTEASICTNYGSDINLVIYNGLTSCTNPLCNLVKPWNTSDNPGCSICSGKYWIPVTSTYSAKAVIRWITQDEIENNLAAGDLQVGDALLEHITYDALTYFSNVITNKVLLNIDGASMLITAAHPTILRTSITVTARRFEPRKGAGSN